jgi:hypothetical protein
LKTGRQVEIVTRTLVKIPIDFSVSFPKNYFIFCGGGGGWGIIE